MISVCDSLCVLGPAAGDGRTWFAKSSDRPPGEAQRLEWHPPRRDDDAVRATHVEVASCDRPTLGVLGSRPAWMWGLEHGVNEAGVAIGNERVFTRRHPKHAAPGLTGMDLVRLGLERASTASEAVAVMTSLLERHGQGGACLPGTGEAYWSSFLVADPNEAYVLETSGDSWSADPVVGSRAISNRLDIDAFDEVEGITSPLLDLCVDGRLAETRRAAGAGAGLDELKATLRSHQGPPEAVEAGWTVCMHVDGEQVTAASIVADLSSSPIEVRVAAGSPCRSVFVPLAVGAVGTPVPWERFASLPAEAAAPLRELEHQLEHDADPTDPSWPDEAWRRVAGTLDRVASTPTPTGGTP